MRQKKMTPVHSRPRAMHSDQGLPQYGGWLAASVKRLPEFEWMQRLSRPRPQRGGGGGWYKNPTTRRPAPSRRKRRRRRRRH